MKKYQRPCRACGGPRHKQSDSALCAPCYWVARRESSPFTGMSQKEYDVQRYNSRIRRDAYLQSKFGITLEEYEARAAEQGQCCAICQRPPRENLTTFGKAFTAGCLVVDHDHATGKVRGLLCDLCNKGLGQFGDSRELLYRAARYLEESA